MSASSKRVVFRLTAAQYAAFGPWARTAFPDAAPSENDAAKAIVLQRLVEDGFLTSDFHPARRLSGDRRRTIQVTASHLQAAREARGLSQAGLAKILAVPRSTLSLWETGAKRIPAHLAPVVVRWVETGEVPRVEELERRERPTVWARLLEDKLPGDDEDE